MDKIIQARLRAWRGEPSGDNAQAVAEAVSRREMDTRARKVLLSPRYGRGFAFEVGYESPEMGKFVAEFEPLIEAVETGSGLAKAQAWGLLRAEVAKRWPEVEHLPNVLEASQAPEDLIVVEVEGPYRIREYDGAEGIETLADSLRDYW